MQNKFFVIKKIKIFSHVSLFPVNLFTNYKFSVSWQAAIRKGGKTFKLCWKVKSKLEIFFKFESYLALIFISYFECNISLVIETEEKYEKANDEPNEKLHFVTKNTEQKYQEGKMETWYTIYEWPERRNNKMMDNF